MTVVDTTQSTRSEATAPLSGRVNWLNALLPAVILLSELPLLVLFFQRLWGSEAYRIFPVVLTVAGMLAYARWPQEVTPLRRRDRWLGYFSLVAGYLAVLAGVALWSPWIAALGSLLTALFLCLYFVRGEALVRFGALWLLLGLLLPLPAPLDMEATAVLQGLAGKAASLWLDALGYNHVLSGQVIHALGLRLVVADGCSPWHSGVMLVLLAAMYIAAVRFPRAPAAMLLLSAVGWSIVANTASLVLRVALHANGTTLAAGSGQTFLAIGILVVILGLMWSTSRFWLCMFAPIAMERREDLPRPVPVVVGSPLLPRQGVVAAVLAFAAVGVAQALPVVRQDGDWGETDQKPARNNLVVNRDAILPLGDRWELADFSLRVDDLSEVRGSAAIAAAEWKLVRGGLTARVRLAYPFRGWRAVSDLHAEEGWEIIKQRGHRSTEAVSASRPGWPDLSPEGTRPADVDSNETGDLPRAIEFEMENPTGDYAYEAIGLLDERGGMIVADLDSGGLWGRVTSAFASRMRHRGSRIETSEPFYDCRVIVVHHAPFTAQDLERFSELYHQVRDRLAGAVRRGDVHHRVGGVGGARSVGVARGSGASTCIGALLTPGLAESSDDAGICDVGVDIGRVAGIGRTGSYERMSGLFPRHVVRGTR